MREDPVSQMGPEQGASRRLVDPDVDTTGIPMDDSEMLSRMGASAEPQRLRGASLSPGGASFPCLVPSESFSE